MTAMTAIPAVCLVRDRHPTLLKWHRGRRTAADVPFTGARIREGLALGASVEIDANRLADGGFAVLHDPTLDRETTGRGRLADMSAADLAGLRLRDGAGNPTTHPVMTLAGLFEGLGGLFPDDMGTTALPASALLQVDLKERAGDLTDAHVAGFAAAVAGFAGNVIVSGGDAAAVARLADAVPGVRKGYDPCEDDTPAQLAASGAFDAFIAGALDTGAGAATIYLDYRILILAARRGIDLVAPVHAAGKTVDAWTLNLDHPDARTSLKTLLDLKVDQITTDDPEAMFAAAAAFI